MLASALDVTKFPPGLKPPAINPEWTKAYLGDKVIPNVPLTQNGNGQSDWTKDITTCNSPNDWAITIDDGTSVFSRNLTEEFRIANAKATFFVVGSQILTFDQELKQLADAGHQIGIHTWSHRELTSQTNEQIVAEIIWTAKIIREVTGFVPKYVRSPRGDIDSRVRAVIEAMGFRHVVWNRDTEDWKSSLDQKNIDQIVGDVSNWLKLPKGKQGIISLHHDIYKDAAAALVPSLKLISQSSYAVKTQAECIGDSNPYDNSILDRIRNIPDVGLVGDLVGNGTVLPPSQLPDGIPTQGPLSSQSKVYPSFILGIIGILVF